MVRSPIFDGKRAGWPSWLEGSRRAEIKRRSAAPLSTAGFLLALLVVSALSALIGGLLARQMPVTQASLTTDVPVRHLAEAGGLLLQLDSVTWLVSAPAGGPRLRINLTLQNPTDQTQRIGPQEFQLRTRSGTSWPASGDSISATTLGPKETLAGGLVFDVPAAASGLELVWMKDRQEVRIPILVHAPGHRAEEPG